MMDDTPRTDAMENSPCPQEYSFAQWHFIKYKVLAKALERESVVQSQRIADLQTQLEQERKAREEAERRLHMWAVEANIAGITDGADGPTRVIRALVSRAEAAELRTQEAIAGAVAVQEACVRVCDEHAATYSVMGSKYAVIAVRDEIRSLTLSPIEAGRELLKQARAEAGK